MKKLVFLHGSGSDKNAYFDPIFAQLPSNVVQVAVFGQTKENLQNFGKKYGMAY